MVGNTPCLSVFGHAFQKELCVLWAGLLTFLMESSLLESFSSSSCVAFRVGPRMQMRYMSVFLPFSSLSAFSPAAQNTERFSEFNPKRVIKKDQEVYLMGGGRRQYKCKLPGEQFLTLYFLLDSR